MLNLQPKISKSPMDGEVSIKLITFKSKNKENLDNALLFINVSIKKNDIRLENK
jgi:hypothetical protein